MKETFKKVIKISVIVLVAIIVLGVVASAINLVGQKTLSQTTNKGFSPSLGMNYAMDLGVGSAREESASSPPSGGSNTNTGSQGIFTEKKIIKNGNLSLYVKEAGEAAQAIQDLAKSVGGNVAESNIYQSADGVKSGNVTIRVPADDFEDIIHNVKQLAVEVERETVTSKDVTEEYMDLEAQIRNLKSEELQYLEIMRQAFTINDTLQVANRLSNVRDRIERTQGRLQYLSRQVDMSTIYISLTADADIEVFGIRWRPLIVVKQASKDTLSGLAGYVDAMVRFLFKLPVIILWLLTFFLAGLVVYKIGRKIVGRIFNDKHKDSE